MQFSWIEKSCEAAAVLIIWTQSDSNSSNTHFPEFSHENRLEFLIVAHKHAPVHLTNFYKVPSTLKDLFLQFICKFPCSKTSTATDTNCPINACRFNSPFWTTKSCCRLSKYDSTHRQNWERMSSSCDLCLYHPFGSYLHRILLSNGFGDNLTRPTEVYIHDIMITCGFRKDNPSKFIITHRWC